MESTKPAHPRVSLCQGEERSSNLRAALSPVIDDIDWASRKSVIIKPNLVKDGHPHAVTHFDALRSVLALVRERYHGPLAIAEGCAEEPTHEVFRHNGFEPLAAEYDAALVDLNGDDAVPFTVYDRQAHPLRVSLARQIIDSDCRISLCPPKTHDAVVVTLSIKNMIMGSIINRRAASGKTHHSWLEHLMHRFYARGMGNDKVAMHQGYPMMNINLARLAPFVLPHLSIVDGFTGMEGAGPVAGEPVPWGIALAGTDALAVDRLTSHLMGFEIDQIGYLHYCAQLGLGCADLDKIEILGHSSPQAAARAFTPHPRYRKQIRWHHPEAARLLRNG
jgi:uncharacterized protein (DUF362 family)